MGKIVKSHDFDIVKSKQKAGMSPARVRQHTKWSEHTIERIFKSNSFGAYKRLITRETAPAKVVKRAEKDGIFSHSNDAGDFLQDGSTTTVKLRPPKQPLWKRLFGLS